MRFYIKNPDNKLQATCRFNKETKILILERSSFINKVFVCKGCSKIEELRLSLIDDNKLKSHNDELYLLTEEIEFNDINSAVCLVLGGHVNQSENIIKNEFGETLAEVYKGALK